MLSTSQIAPYCSQHTVTYRQPTRYREIFSLSQEVFTAVYETFINYLPRCLKWITKLQPLANIASDPLLRVWGHRITLVFIVQQTYHHMLTSNQNRTDATRIALRFDTSSWICSYVYMMESYTIALIKALAKTDSTLLPSAYIKALDSWFNKKLSKPRVRRYTYEKYECNTSIYRKLNQPIRCNMTVNCQVSCSILP